MSSSRTITSHSQKRGLVTRVAALGLASWSLFVFTQYSSHETNRVAMTTDTRTTLDSFLLQEDGIQSSNSNIRGSSSTKKQQHQQAFLDTVHPWNAGGRLVDTLQGLSLAEQQPRQLNNRRLSSVQEQEHTHQVNFIDSSHIQVNQAFAATWWQSLDSFRTMPVEKVEFCEDATRQALRGRDYRLTVDWTDFGVEHLSRWWKIAGYDVETNSRTGTRDEERPIRYKAAYQRILRNLVHYVLRGTASPPAVPVHALPAQTLALVAYLPNRPSSSSSNDSNPQRAERLTMASLAATLASLVKQGMGRVVVVADNEDYDYTLHRIWPVVVRLLQYLQESPTTLDAESILELLDDSQLEGNHNDTYQSSPLANIFGTQLRLVGTATRHSHKIYVNQKMVPRQTVLDAHAALFDPANTPMDAQVAWLGSSAASAPWKYVYLTEPDSILLTKTRAFDAFQEQLDQGRILAPHRMQPLPHELDLVSSSSSVEDTSSLTVTSDPPPQVVVPAEGPWSTVQAVGDNHDNSEADACCDAGTSVTDPNGDHGHCGTFWYLCGFGSASEGLDGAAAALATPSLDRFARLTERRFVQWTDGTRLVGLASSNAGRQCVPRNTAVEGPCPVPPTIRMMQLQHLAAKRAAK